MKIQLIDLKPKACNKSLEINQRFKHFLFERTLESSSSSEDEINNLINKYSDCL